MDNYIGGKRFIMLENCAILAIRINKAGRDENLPDT